MGLSVSLEAFLGGGGGNLAVIGKEVEVGACGIGLREGEGDGLLVGIAGGFEGEAVGELGDFFFGGEEGLDVGGRDVF